VQLIVLLVKSLVRIAAASGIVQLFPTLLFVVVFFVACPHDLTLPAVPLSLDVHATSLLLPLLQLLHPPLRPAGLPR
jgi:hypothetical protein